MPDPSPPTQSRPLLAAAAGAGLGLGLCLPALLLVAAPAPAAGPVPYPEAVRSARKAADAVLSRAGQEACLRGKLTRALLGLSSSCEASGERNPLCSFADRAVVVTPMTLSFMDSTARQLLQLSAAPPASLPGSSR